MPSNHPTRCNHPRRHHLREVTCTREHLHEGMHSAPGYPSWDRGSPDDDAHGTVHVSIPVNLDGNCNALHPRGMVQCTRPAGHGVQHVSRGQNGIPVATWPADPPHTPALRIDRDLISTHVRADVRVIALLDDDEVLTLGLGSVSIADPDRIAGDLATLLRGALRALTPDPLEGLRDLVGVLDLPEPFDTAASERRYADTVQRVHDKVTPVVYGYAHLGSPLHSVPALRNNLALRGESTWLTEPGMALLGEHTHRPVKHDDGLKKWCDTCGLGRGDRWPDRERWLSIMPSVTRYALDRNVARAMHLRPAAAPSGRDA